MLGPPAMRTVAPSSRRSTSAVAGANTCSAGERVHARVQCQTQTARLHHVAERLVVACLAMVEMQEQRRGGAAEAAVADADVEDGTRGRGQRIPHAGLLAAAGASRRQWRRRGHRTPGAPSAAARRGPPPRWRSRRRPAGTPACRRPGRLPPRRPRPKDARSRPHSGAGRHIAGKPCSAASATQVFAAYSCGGARTAGAKGQDSHGHPPEPLRHAASPHPPSAR